MGLYWLVADRLDSWVVTQVVRNVRQSSRTAHDFKVKRVGLLDDIFRVVNRAALDADFVDANIAYFSQ